MVGDWSHLHKHFRLPCFDLQMPQAPIKQETQLRGLLSSLSEGAMVHHVPGPWLLTVRGREERKCVNVCVSGQGGRGCWGEP